MSSCGLTNLHQRPATDAVTIPKAASRQPQVPGRQTHAIHQEPAPQQQQHSVRSAGAQRAAGVCASHTRPFPTPLSIQHRVMTSTACIRIPAPHDLAKLAYRAPRAARCRLQPARPRSALAELDAVGPRRRVLLRLKVVQRQPKLAQHRVAQLLELACAAWRWRKHASGTERPPGQNNAGTHPSATPEEHNLVGSKLPSHPRPNSPPPAPRKSFNVPNCRPCCCSPIISSLSFSRRSVTTGSSRCTSLAASLLSGSSSTTWRQLEGGGRL